MKHPALSIDANVISNCAVYRYAGLQAKDNSVTNHQSHSICLWDFL